MAEWFKRSTVNTFYKGSNPFKSLQNLKIRLESFFNCYLILFLICNLYLINIRYNIKPGTSFIE